MIDFNNLHVYTDRTDWLIGTSAEDAIEYHCKESGCDFAEYLQNSGGRFVQLDDGEQLTIRDFDGNGNCATKTIREWIQWHVASPTSGTNGNWSRLLSSTEY